MDDVFYEALKLIVPHTSKFKPTAKNSYVFSFFFDQNVDLDYILQQINLMNNKKSKNLLYSDLYWPQNFMNIAELINQYPEVESRSNLLFYLLFVTSLGLLDSNTTFDQKSNIAFFIYDKLKLNCHDSVFANFKRYFYLLFVFFISSQKLSYLRDKLENQTFSGDLIKSFDEFHYDVVTASNFQVIRYFSKVNLDKNGIESILFYIENDPLAPGSIKFLQKHLKLENDSITSVYSTIFNFLESNPTKLKESCTHLLHSMELTARKDCSLLASKIYEREVRDFEKDFLYKYATKELSIKASHEDLFALKNFIFASSHPDDFSQIKRLFLVETLLEDEDEFPFVLKCINESIYNRIMVSREGLDSLLYARCMESDEYIDSLAKIAQLNSTIEFSRLVFNYLGKREIYQKENYYEYIQRFSKLLEYDRLSCPLTVGPTYIHINGLDLNVLNLGITFAFWIFIEKTDSFIQTPLFTIEGKMFTLVLSISQNNELIIMSENQSYHFQRVQTGQCIPLIVTLKAFEGYLLVKITANSNYEEHEGKVGITNTENNFKAHIITGNDSLSFYMLAYNILHDETSARMWLSETKNTHNKVVSETDTHSGFLNNRIQIQFSKSNKFDLYPLIEVITDCHELKVLMPLFAFAVQHEKNIALIQTLEILRGIFINMPRAVNIFINNNLHEVLFHILHKANNKLFDEGLFTTLCRLFECIQDNSAKEKFVKLLNSPFLISKYSDASYDIIFKYWDDLYDQGYLDHLDVLITMEKTQNEYLDQIVLKLCKSKYADQVIKSIVAYSITYSHRENIDRFLHYLTMLIIEDSAIMKQYSDIIRAIENIFRFGDIELAVHAIIVFSNAHQRGIFPFSFKKQAEKFDFSMFENNKLFLSQLIGLDIPALVPAIIDMAIKIDMNALQILFTSNSVDFSESCESLIQHLDKVPKDFRPNLYKALLQDGLNNITYKALQLYSMCPKYIFDFLNYTIQTLSFEEANELTVEFLTICFQFILFQNIENNWVFKLRINKKGKWVDLDLASKCIDIYQKILSPRLIKYDLITSGFLMRYQPDKIRNHLVFVMSREFSNEILPYKDFIVYNGRRFNIDVDFISIKRIGFESMDIISSFRPPIPDISALIPAQENDIPVKIDPNPVFASVTAIMNRIGYHTNNAFVSKMFWQILWFKLTQKDEFYFDSLYPKPILQGFEKVDNFIGSNWTNVRFKPNKHYTVHAEASLKRDSNKNEASKQRLAEEKRIIQEYNDQLKETPVLLRRRYFTTSMLRTFEYVHLKHIGENEEIVFKSKAIYINQSREQEVEFEFRVSIFFVRTELKEKAFLVKDVKCIVPRTHFHKLNSLQFILLDGSTYFYVFPGLNSANILDSIKIHIPSNIDIYKSPFSGISFGDITQKWSTGEISNFSYLMHLNNLAGRNNLDICQYPIMPWSLADYRVPLCGPPRSPEMMMPKLEDDDDNNNSKAEENDQQLSVVDCQNPYDISSLSMDMIRDMSKPLGALNEERLVFLKARASSLEPPHLYSSTHISAPSVFLLLVRTEPFTSLHIKFQSGQFDRPMRIFASVANNHEISLTQRNDFFEVPPEFYFAPEFLMNLNKFDFGGPNDVVLPPWASTPYEFVDKHRKILEKAPIEKWIDLVFGYLQRGPNAEKANNIYMPYLYSNVWEDKECPPETQVEIMLKHVGQVPPQLFTSPHPARQVMPLKCAFDSPHPLRCPVLIDDVIIGFIADNVKGVARDRKGVFYKIFGPLNNPTFAQIDSTGTTPYSLSTPHSYFCTDTNRKQVIYREATNSNHNTSFTIFGKIISMNSTNNFGTAITEGEVYAFGHNNNVIMRAQRHGTTPYVCSAIRKEFDIFIACDETKMSLFSIRHKALYKVVDVDKPQRAFITPVMGNIMLLNNESIQLYNVNGFFIKKSNNPGIVSLDIGRFRDADIAFAVLANGSVVSFDVFDMNFKVVLEGSYSVVRVVRNGNCVMCISDDGSSMFVPISL